MVYVAERRKRGQSIVTIRLHTLTQGGLLVSQMGTLTTMSFHYQVTLKNVYSLTGVPFVVWRSRTQGDTA